MTEAKPWPTELRLREQGTQLHVAFDTGATFDLSAEYLRIESPSAEVKGHGPGQEVTVPGKRAIRITNVEPVGNYAVKIVFDDGHSTGLYSWDYLHKLGDEEDDLWAGYLSRLAEQGLGRD